MGFYHVLQVSYRKALPQSVRTFLAKSPLTGGMFHWTLHHLQKNAAHDDVYDKVYYESTVDPAAAASAPVIASSLLEEVKPKTIVDVGCGTGQVLLAFEKLGIKGRGLEYSEAALAICKSRGLDVQKFDIESNLPTDWKADLAITMEVAEHLPARCADVFVDLLCGIAPTVFMTAAIPGSPGTDHVNEQPNEYWIEKFKNRGYRYEQDLSMNWRKVWAERGVSSWYCQSAMLFRRNG